MRFAPFAAAALLLAAVPASAQVLPRESELDLNRSVERHMAIAVNPLLALAGIVQADYELRLGREATLGVGAGYTDLALLGVGESEDLSFLVLDVKGRFYPDAAFQGFSMGGSVGLARAEWRNDEDAEETSSAMTIGVEVGRSWLMGDDGRWYMTSGVGAKRYFFRDVDIDVPVILPTFRFGFGLAF